MVVSGEVPLALAVYSHMIEEARQRGAPVDWFAIDPMIARSNGIGVSRKPPHPNAALLFYEYTIGDAQPLMLKMNYLSPLRKLASPLRGARILFVDPAADSAEVERCDNAYDALIRRQEPRSESHPGTAMGHPVAPALELHPMTENRSLLSPGRFARPNQLPAALQRVAPVSGAALEQDEAASGIGDFASHRDDAGHVLQHGALVFAEILAGKAGKIRRQGLPHGRGTRCSTLSATGLLTALRKEIRPPVSAGTTGFHVIPCCLGGARQREISYRECHGMQSACRGSCLPCQPESRRTRARHAAVRDRHRLGETRSLRYPMRLHPAPRRRPRPARPAARRLAAGLDGQPARRHRERFSVIGCSSKAGAPGVPLPFQDGSPIAAPDA